MSRTCWGWPISGRWKWRRSTSCSSCSRIDVGSVAHIQICGTTSCMICGAEDLVAVAKELIALDAPYSVGRWQVQLGRGRMPGGLRQCADGPDRQGLLRGPDRRKAARADRAVFAKGEVPVPGPQNGRYAAEPIGGLTSLKDFEAGRPSTMPARSGGGPSAIRFADRRHGSAADADALAWQNGGGEAPMARGDR